MVGEPCDYGMQLPRRGFLNLGIETDVERLSGLSPVRHSVPCGQLGESIGDRYLDRVQLYFTVLEVP